MNHADHATLSQEFDRQINNLLQRGYPAAAGLPTGEFLKHLKPLKVRIEDIVPLEVDLEQGQLPFVIVVKSDLVSVDKAMSLVERNGQPGCTKLYPREPHDFTPIDEVRLPDGPAYLLVDIDRGKGSLNLAPGEALKVIRTEQRSPITIDEGVALVTQYPAFLMKNNCFSLLASRYRGDKRVPAIWINHAGQPNLGWCWDGNPHTWLGSASCGSRV